MWRLVWAKLVGSDGKPYSASNPLPVDASVTVDTSALETLTGSKTETAPATDTASSGLNGRLQRIAQRVTALIALVPSALGANASSNSLSTAVATDDVMVGSRTETAPASDTASSGLNGRLQRLAQRVTALIALVPSALGANASSNSLSTAVATDDVMVGSRTETAPASDTASSGLNGRLQRLAQRVTSLIALVPSALGRAVSASSFAVTEASDSIIRSRFFSAAASAMTRPANTTAYTAADAVSNNATAGSVTAISFTLSDTNDDPIAIEAGRILSTDTGPGTAGAAFELWLFNSDPTASTGVGGGDNAAFSQKQDGFIGKMSGTFFPASDGSIAELAPASVSRILAAPVSGAKTVYALLKTLTAFTPSANSTTFTCSLQGYQGRV